MTLEERAALWQAVAMGAIPSDDEERRSSPRHPLLAVATIVGAMLLIPAFLYSVAPEEPLKEGIMVFATSKQRVDFVDPTAYAGPGYGTSCVLETGDPLVTIRVVSPSGDGPILARVEGRTTIEYPFCPPGAVVIVKAHLLMHKEPLWQELRQAIARLFNT